MNNIIGSGIDELNTISEKANQSVDIKITTGAFLQHKQLYLVRHVTLPSTASWIEWIYCIASRLLTRRLSLSTHAINTSISVAIFIAIQLWKLALDLRAKIDQLSEFP